MVFSPGVASCWDSVPTFFPPVISTPPWRLLRGPPIPQTGCLAAHRLLYGFVLALVTLQSMILCQYGTSCCGSPLEIAELFAARVVSVLVGCTLPVLVTQAVLPW